MFVETNASPASPSPRHPGGKAAVLVVAAVLLTLLGGFAAVLAAQARADAGSGWVLWDAQGEQQALADRRGKVVVLLVGDAERPLWEAEADRALRRLMARYGESSGVELLAVQTGPDAGRRARAGGPLAGHVPVLLDPAGHTVSLYHLADAPTDGGPAFVVIDAAGRARGTLPLADSGHLDAAIDGALDNG